MVHPNTRRTNRGACRIHDCFRRAEESGYCAFHEERVKQWQENIQCPVCGYYCLGKGGFGCIDKPKLQKI